MGLGDLFKGLVSKAEPAPDYQSLSKEELLNLSAQRAALTPKARAALTAELDRRHLAARTSRPANDDTDGPSTPPIEGDPIIVHERGGVILRTQANAGVMIFFPLWDDTPIALERPAMKANVTDLIFLNDGAGELFAEAVVDQLKITNGHAFAMNQETLPTVEDFKETEMGALILERASVPNVLLARWHGEDMVVALGPQVPPALLVERDDINVVLGGLTPPQNEAEQEALVELAQVVLLLDAATVDSWPLMILPQLGVQVAPVGMERGSESDQLLVSMKHAVDDEDWDKAAALLEELAAQEIEDVVDGLTIEGNLDAAARVVDLALQSEDWAETGRIHFLRGVNHAMAAEPDKAADCYRRAVEGEEPEPRAYAYLSALSRRKGDHAAAIDLAKKGLEALPEDTVAAINLIAAHATAGEKEAALEMVDLHRALLGVVESEAWRARVESGDVTVDDLFPHLANKAYQLGCMLRGQGRSGPAIQIFRRCLELMPSHMEAVLELGALLPDEVAMSLYDTQLQRTPGLSLVRFSRAMCLLRLERRKEAVEDLRQVVREVPDFTEARSALESALHSE